MLPSRWFCHFDDDNYVNVPALVKKLGGYDHRNPHYLGKPSLARPLRISEVDGSEVAFSFATGGAGFCLSRAAATGKMLDAAGGGRFEVGLISFPVIFLHCISTKNKKNQNIPKS